MSEWKSKSHSKYLLQYHLIFVCKYRKKLLLSKNISEDIKQLSYDICKKHNITIKEMEVDKDHIHYMIETIPNVNISNIIKMIKSYTTFHIWRLHKKYLSKHFLEREYILNGWNSRDSLGKLVSLEILNRKHRCFSIVCISL